MMLIGEPTDRLAGGAGDPLRLTLQIGVVIGACDWSRTSVIPLRTRALIR